MTTTATFAPITGIKRAFAALCVGLLLAPTLASAPAAAHQVERFVSLIVQGVSPAAVEGAVTSVGGEVTRTFPLIQGVEAKVPSGSADKLRSSQGIFNVARNVKMGFQGRPDTKMALRVQKTVNADDLWDDGIDGSGVTVAVLDTGIYAQHPDLAGRVVHCVDFSHEAANPDTRCQDTFGHGTFMAGLIAGDGTSSHGTYMGVAPNANLVSIKAAGYDGSTDVSNVLAGIQWAVAFKDTYGIDVLSLSLGTDSSLGTRLSPLNFAVEQAWKAGIVVVVSSSNRGPGSETVTSPGDSPFVITVGASNDEGSPKKVSDDQVPVFSGRGPTAEGLAKPDVVSPGVSTVSLRSPGSYIDNNFGSTAAIGDHYFKGTGTSMSTATTAGVAAQIVQANPGLTPDQVKFRMMDTARQIANTDPNAAGKGLIDAYRAATSSSLEAANANVEPSTGLGSVQGARGSLDVWVETPLGSAALVGEVTAYTDPGSVSLSNPLGLLAYDPVEFTTTGWDATKWTATKWTGTKWTATKWTGAEFEATKWTGTKWTGTKWTNSDWDATKWTSTDWDATKWTGTKWTSYWYAVAWD